MAVALQGCGPRGDAALYVAALSEDPRYGLARDHCAAIDDVQTRGDCLVAVMERFGQLDAAECLALEQAEPELVLWRDECVFQLAERLRARGRMDDALRLCLDTRFSRECAWHLVQDEAEASLRERPEVAELRLSRFSTARRLPDAALQFWMIRFRAQAAAGTPVDEASCGELQRPEPCLEALRRHVRLRLDGLRRVDPDRTCRLDADPADIVDAEATWVDGPVVRATVAEWRARRCRQGR